MSAWAPTPEVPDLLPATIHVWKIDIASLAPDLDQLRRKLDEEEQRKASAFHFERDRVRYIVAHCVRRVLLGQYLGMDPRSIQFRQGAHGKPALAPSHAIDFNMSHSDTVALLAVGLDRELGVDAERIRPELTGEEIARHYFAPGEVAALRQVDPGRRHEAFFACWTRKEAYIKARGKGLSIPLDSFEVSLAPGEPAALLSVSGEPAANRLWQIRALDVGAGYAGALATEGAVEEVTCYQWIGR